MDYALELRWEADDAGCWNWTGSKLPTGYGTLHIPGQRSPGYAHRVSYEQSKGPIPAGFHVDHLCKNTSCCNPDHLEAVTPAENNRRSDSPTARNLRKTHCPRGHPYDAENTRVNPAGRRSCRTCRQIARRVEGGPGVPPGDRTHCPQGHPYDETNTYRPPGGQRQCRKCVQMAQKRWRERKRRARV